MCEAPVWCLVMFDLPVKTKAERTKAIQYRQMLLDVGFTMIQLSVYVKYVTTTSGVRITAKQIKGNIPPKGKVRMLYVSDSVWAKTLVFYGKKELKAEPTPSQLTLF